MNFHKFETSLGYFLMMMVVVVVVVMVKVVTVVVVMKMVVVVINNEISYSYTENNSRQTAFPLFTSAQDVGSYSCHLLFLSQWSPATEKYQSLLN